MRSKSTLAAGVRLLHQHLMGVTILLALLVGLSAWGAWRLKVNTNQIELLPQDLRAVKEARRVSEMVGGLGFLMLALKSDNETLLKQVADDLAPLIEKLPEVRGVRYKVDGSFVRKRIGLYLSTEDLKEVRKRVKAKIRYLVRQNNPFHIELRKTQPVELDLDDIIEKYSTVGKKRIADDYHITQDKQMLLLLIKPQGNATDLAFIRKLLVRIEQLIADYNTTNTRAAVLEEGYHGLVAGANVTYGYTGGYKRNLDDSDSIFQSLVPTSLISISGILILLLLFLRRVVLVVGLISSLVIGVLLTFGFCYVAIGELNSITAILAGILMGQGIDFGIQFIYRVREEYTRDRDLLAALEAAMRHLGPAAITTACSTSAAFFALTISDFKGFRDFGLMAGGGTFLIAGCMLFGTTIFLLLIHRVWPKYLDRMLITPTQRSNAEENVARIPIARWLVAGSVALSALLFVAAWGVPDPLKTLFPQQTHEGVKFDYDARSLLIKDRPSVILQEEIKDRFHISADPAAVYTATLEDTRDLYDHMRPATFLGLGKVDPERFDAVDSVLNLFMFVPDKEQQLRNIEILAQIKKDLEPIKPAMLVRQSVSSVRVSVRNERREQGTRRAHIGEYATDEKRSSRRSEPAKPGQNLRTVELVPKWRKHYDQVHDILDVEPFELEDVPDLFQKQFRNIPSSTIKGYLTFIYPRVALWDSRDLMVFSDQIAEIKTEGKTFYATGMAILFARLAGIVLHDGKLFTAIACIAILLILFVSLRSVTATLVTLIPLVLGVTWMLGLMALLGQRINFMNVVVFPVVLGYGMGNGIYILYRFRESGSARVALSRTGRAVVASSVTTLVGWGSLLAAMHLGLESMGVLASLGIGCVLITSLVILPALLQLLEGRFKWRSTGL